MQKFKSHKIVEAARIDSMQVTGRTRTLKLVNAPPVEVDQTWCAKHQPEVGGYYVVYPDHYTSYSPAKAFEDGYTVLVDTAPADLTAKAGSDPILEFFAYEHLPYHLQEISRPFGELVIRMVGLLPRNAERSAMFRKILEGKDCAVRAKLASPPPTVVP
jgi:hypothetical protein